MRSIRRGVLAAALGVAALAPGCGQRGGAAGIVRASAIGTYPKESVALLVLEVKKVRTLGGQAPWMKRLASLADEPGGPFQEAVKRLGADTIERLNRLSVAVVPDTGNRVAYGILAEGAFDPGRLREALGGQDLLTLVEAEGGQDFSVTVLPDGSLALGPRRILDVMRTNAAARGQGLDGNPALLAPLERVRPEAQLWGALDCRNLGRTMRSTGAAGDLGGLSLPATHLDALVSLALRGTIGESVVLDLLGRADTEANARNLADAARGLVALGRIGASRDQAKAWLEFLDGIRIDQKGADLSVRAAIPPATMQTFVEQIASARPQAVPVAARPAAPSGSPMAAPSSPARPGSGAQEGRTARPDPSPRDTRSPARRVPGNAAGSGSSSAAPPAY